MYFIERKIELKYGRKEGKKEEINIPKMNEIKKYYVTSF